MLHALNNWTLHIHQVHGMQSHGAVYGLCSSLEGYGCDMRRLVLATHVKFLQRYMVRMSVRLTVCHT